MPSYEASTSGTIVRQDNIPLNLLCFLLRSHLFAAGLLQERVNRKTFSFIFALFFFIFKMKSKQIISACRCYLFYHFFLLFSSLFTLSLYLLTNNLLYVAVAPFFYEIHPPIIYFAFCAFSGKSSVVAVYQCNEILRRLL